MPVEAAFQRVLAAIGDSALGRTIAENAVIFPWLETVHVFAIACVFGSILIVDLRLVGLASRDMRISGLTRALVPVTWAAFAVAAVTGSLMIASKPVDYLANTALRVKLGLLVLAAVNMATFHLVTGRGQGDWDDDAVPPARVRLAGAVSLATWIGIVTAGRWIGFTMSPF